MFNPDPMSCLKDTFIFTWYYYNTFRTSNFKTKSAVPPTCVAVHTQFFWQSHRLGISQSTLPNDKRIHNLF